MSNSNVCGAIAKRLLESRKVKQAPSTGRPIGKLSACVSKGGGGSDNEEACPGMVTPMLGRYNAEPGGWYTRRRPGTLLLVATDGKHPSAPSASKLAVAAPPAFVAENESGVGSRWPALCGACGDHAGMHLKLVILGVVSACRGGPQLGRAMLFLDCAELAGAR